MSNKNMLYYINETTEALNIIIDKRKELFNNFIQEYNSKDYRNIYLIGSGTSYNACLTARPFLEKVLKKNVIAINSYDFAHYEELANCHDLILAITQEGESTNTIDALKRANKLNCDNFVITERKDNTCAKVAKKTILLACGFENIGPKTKGYSSSILTFYLLGIEAAYSVQFLNEDEYMKYINRLTDTVKNIPQIISQTQNWFEINKADLVKCKHAYVLGYGNNIGTIAEGALKSLETVREYFQSFELEEFLHGPIASMHENTYIIIISPKEYGYDRANTLFKALNEQTRHVYAIGEQAGVMSKHVLTAPFKNDPDFNPIEYCVPMQLFAYLLYTNQGKDLNVRNYPNIKHVLVTKADEL